jgi:hypothetical protein
MNAWLLAERSFLNFFSFVFSPNSHVIYIYIYRYIYIYIFQRNYNK